MCEKGDHLWIVTAPMRLTVWFLKQQKGTFIPRTDGARSCPYRVKGVRRFGHPSRVLWLQWLRSGVTWVCCRSSASGVLPPGAVSTGLLSANTLNSCCCFHNFSSGNCSAVTSTTVENAWLGLGPWYLQRKSRLEVPASETRDRLFTCRCTPFGPMSVTFSLCRQAMLRGESSCRQAIPFRENGCDDLAALIKRSSYSF